MTPTAWLGGVEEDVLARRLHWLDKSEHNAVQIGIKKSPFSEDASLRFLVPANRAGPGKKCLMVFYS